MGDDPRAGWRSYWDLAYEYLTSWQRTGDRETLDVSVALLREGRHFARDRDEETFYLVNLAKVLAARYDVTAHAPDLVESVALYEAAVRRVPIEEPRRPHLLLERARRLDQLRSGTSDPAALSEVVAAWREALATSPDGSRDRARCRVGLGKALARRHAVAPVPEDLDEAVLLLHTALSEEAWSVVEEADLAIHLADLLLSRAERDDRPADLDTALEFLDAVPEPEGVVREALLIKRCRLLRLQYRVTGHLATLEESIACGREALGNVTPGNSAAAHGVLAEALLERHRRTAAPEDLDEAIELLHRVVDLPGPNRRSVVVTLARCLLARAEPTRHPNDVVRAIDLLRSALAETDADPMLSSELGFALLRLHERTKEPEPLLAAFATFNASLGKLPEDHPRYRSTLANMGEVMERLYVLTHDVTQLEYAVGLHRRALALCPRGDDDYPKFVDGLGYALRKLYDATGSRADLEECVAVLRRAVDAFPEHDPRGLPTRISLAQALRARQLVTGENDGLSEAVDVALAGARNPAGGVFSRMEAFAAAGHALATLGEWARAVEVFTEAVALTPRLVSRGRTRFDQYADLGQTAGLSPSAAACALNAGRPDRALELLERGRGVLLSRRLTPGGGPTALRRADPVLAEEYERLRREFDAPAPSPPRPLSSGRDREAEWEDFVNRIRRLPGLADFLRPVTADQLVNRVAGATVVVLVASGYRCDALLLRDRHVEALPLPELTFDDVVRNRDLLREAVLTAHDPDTGTRARLRAQQTLRELLDWLWRTTVCPVLDHLTLRSASRGEWPRLWWCPVGPLTVFPLHAAQSHDGESALDYVVSSYTPTVEALGRVRARKPVARERAASCVVAMSRTPGEHGPLPSAAGEARVVADALPRPRVWTDEEVTSERVLAELATSTHAHFACHAVTTPDLDLGRLLTHDHEEHPLTVTDISALNLDGELAFLSACATTLSAPALADEALHITGAFLLAGFRHVVGTLWEVDDAAALEITSAFYRAGHDADSAPSALHDAVRSLRDRYPFTPSLWAAHIHTGA